MNDFATDMEAMGVAQREAEYRRPTPERGPASLASALDFLTVPGVLPPGVVVTKEPLGHPCSRCSATAAAAEARGSFIPRVHEAMSFVGFNGRTYWAGLCVSCGEIEFSIRWNARRALAAQAGNMIAFGKLDGELQTWRSKGRKYLG